MFKCEEIRKDLPRAKKFFENILSFTVGSFTLEDMIKNKLDAVNIADVRNYEDYIEGHIPYAVHIPYADIEKHINMLDKSKITIVYTYNDSCIKAYDAALTMLDNKYPSAVLRGGFHAWKKHGLEIVKNSAEE